MNQLRIPRWLLLCTVLLSIMRTQVLAQGTGPDRDLLAKAQQASAAGQWGDAAKAMESLRQQYPTSAVLPEGMVLLYQAYLNVPSPEKAAAVGKEIVNRWPKTAHVWQVVLITTKQKAKISAAEAVAALELALKQEMLSPADRMKAQNQRLLYLARAQSTQFLTEAIERIKALKLPISQENLLFAADLAKTIYPLLMAEGRFDEAKALSDKLQETLVRAGNPAGGLLGDQQAYLAALKTVDAKRFAAEATLAIKQALLGDSPEEAIYAAGLATAIYPGLLKGKPYEEVKALHAGIQEALQAQQLAKPLRDEMGAWLKALADAHPDRLLAEITGMITQVTAARSAEEITLPVEYMALVYASCFTNKKPEEAKAFHTQIQGILAKFTLTDDAVTDAVFYQCERLLYLRKHDKKQYFADALAVMLELAGQCTRLPQGEKLWRVASQGSVYDDLATAGLLEETTRLYQRVQVALVKMQAGEYYTWTNELSYLYALIHGDPAYFLTEYLALAAKTEKQCDHGDLQALMSTISLNAYQFLAADARFDDMKKVHKQLQDAAKRVPDTALFAAAEFSNYLTALADASPEDFTAEMQPMLDQLAKIQTMEETAKVLPFIQMAYRPLNQCGNFLAARTAHEQVQALLKRFNKTAEMAGDYKKYQDSLSIQALDGMLKLFTKAMAANDTAAARKWLDELNAAAPEAPQAIRARKLWKDAGVK